MVKVWLSQRSYFVFKDSLRSSIICALMTESADDKKPHSKEAEALLKAAIARTDEVRMLHAKSGDPVLGDAIGRASEAVTAIRRAIASGNVDVPALASIGGQITSATDIAETQTDAPVVSYSAVVTANIRVSTAALQSRALVQKLSQEIFDQHLFEADVARHTHGLEFEAFMRRKAEDEKYIREQLAKKTAEGDLNASGKLEGYMLDANAHGAGDNAEFITKWNELKAKTDNLRTAMKAAGKDTGEYDKNIREDVTDFLKAKGLSDAEIQKAISKSDDPLDAVKPYLGTDTESRTLANHIRVANRVEDRPVVQVAVAPNKEAPLTIDMDAMSARLAAAGLDAPASDPTGHGLTIAKPAKGPDVISR